MGVAIRLRLEDMNGMTNPPCRYMKLICDLVLWDHLNMLTDIGVQISLKLTNRSRYLVHWRYQKILLLLSTSVRSNDTEIRNMRSQHLIFIFRGVKGSFSTSRDRTTIGVLIDITCPYLVSPIVSGYRKMVYLFVE